MFTEYVPTISAVLIAIAVGVLGKIVYDWLLAKKPNSCTNESTLDARNESRLIKIGDEIDWLKDVHNKVDADGIPVWYSSRDLKVVVKEMADRGIETNLLLRSILEEIKDNGKLMCDVMREVQSLK